MQSCPTASLGVERRGDQGRLSEDDFLLSLSELEVIMGFQAEGIEKERLESDSNCVRLGWGGVVVQVDPKSALMSLELNM